jgi:hypothetical protein
MADAQNLPANLRFFMSRLQGVSTSHYKVYSTAGDTGTANKIMRFELPSNVLINLKSTRLFFNASTSGTAASRGRLPEDTRSLIERMTIYAGGVQIQNGHNAYNVLAHAKKALTGMECESMLTHPELVRTQSYHSNLPVTNAESYLLEDNQLCIDSFDGFLGTAAPGIIDTGIFPQITIEFTLADNSVTSASAGTFLKGGALLEPAPAAPAPARVAGQEEFTTVGTTAISYTLSNMTLQIEVLGMASSILDEIVAERISQVGYLSIPFKNYYTFTAQHASTTRFNVNSSSLDRIWCCWRNTNYAANPSAPVVVNGYKVAGAYTAASSASVAAQTAAAGGGASGNAVAGQTAFNIYQDIGKPQYDIGGTHGTNTEKYQSQYFKFAQVLAGGSTKATYQLQINGANYPAYRLNTPEALSLSLNSVDYFINSNRKMTLDQYKNNYCVQAYRFCLPESDAYRLASGLDTRATSAQCAVLTEGLDLTTQHLTIFAECTAECRVASRQVEVIP